MGKTMNDAVLNYSPTKLGSLFAIMLNTCGISEPMSLWMKFKESICENNYRNARNIDDKHRRK